MEGKEDKGSQGRQGKVGGEDEGKGGEGKGEGKGETYRGDERLRESVEREITYREDMEKICSMSEGAGRRIKKEKRKKKKKEESVKSA